jgi:hypothetical protein
MHLFVGGYSTQSLLEGFTKTMAKVERLTDTSTGLAGSLTDITQGTNSQWVDGEQAPLAVEHILPTHSFDFNSRCQQ